MMKISVKVKPNSRESRVENLGEKRFLVAVKAPPQEGRANREVVEILATYFCVPKSQIALVGGLKSKQKIVEIEEG